MPLRRASLMPSKPSKGWRANVSPRFYQPFPSSRRPERLHTRDSSPKSPRWMTPPSTALIMATERIRPNTLISETRVSRNGGAQASCNIAPASRNLTCVANGTPWNRPARWRMVQLSRRRANAMILRARSWGDSPAIDSKPALSRESVGFGRNYAAIINRGSTT